jgi:deoxyadenosine/deoxycytidine kinase
MQQQQQQQQETATAPRIYQQAAVFTIDRMAIVASYTSIQGDIGAGKSTLKRHMERWVEFAELDARRIDDNSPAGDYFLFVAEPVDEWSRPLYYHGLRYGETPEHPGEPSSLLQLFYEKPAEYAFLFQVAAFTSRLQTLVNELSSVPLITRQVERGIRIHIIGERSLRTDRVFFRLQYLQRNASDAEWRVYNAFFDTICRHLLQLESAMIYLPTPPAVCAERVERRNRTGESGVSLDYLTQFYRQQEVMIDTFQAESAAHRVYRLDAVTQEMDEPAIEVVAAALMTQLRVDLSRV